MLLPQVLIQSNKTTRRQLLSTGCLMWAVEARTSDPQLVELVL